MTDKPTVMKTKEMDPGWNDPPLFSYESHQSQSRQSKGLSLNKRVVFPISTNTESPKTESMNDVGSTPNEIPITSTLPPPLAAETPPKSSAMINILSTAATNLANDNGSENVDTTDLKVVLRNFNEILQEAYGAEEKEAIEIRRRLTIMEKMWNDDKFNNPVKEKIYKLSKVLKEDKFDDSDSLQRSLMVDHTNVCSNWMAGIRKLIYRKRDMTSS